jgi:Raf kinase inhibitor-like YbhB/YbcL family protein
MWFMLALSVALASGCRNSPETDSDLKGGVTMQLTSSAFREGETIPKQYTADGSDVSPPLRWTGAPAGTKCFVAICDDPDAPRGTWTHWVLLNLPADATELPEGVPAQETLANGARHGKNSWSSNNVRYRGPDPPAGKPHRYFFKIYALDNMLDLPAGSAKDNVEKAMKGHVLGHGQLMGTYGR